MHNVLAFQKALGESSGNGHFYLGEVETASSALRRIVHQQEITTGFESIDNIVSALSLVKLNVVKLDVEGSEIEVLRGAIKTLSAFAPKLCIEIHDFGPSFLEISRVLRDLGYTEVFRLTVESTRGILYAQKPEMH